MQPATRWRDRPSGKRRSSSLHGRVSRTFREGGMFLAASPCRYAAGKADRLSTGPRARPMSATENDLPGHISVLCCTEAVRGLLHGKLELDLGGDAGSVNAGAHDGTLDPGSAGTRAVGGRLTGRIRLWHRSRSRPPGRAERIEWAQVASPIDSKTTSTLPGSGRQPEPRFFAVRPPVRTARTSDRAAATGAASTAAPADRGRSAADGC